jgi:hypothetical protein
MSAPSSTNNAILQEAMAMDMTLKLLFSGEARIERTGKLQEFCFRGIRYCHNGSYQSLIHVIGWDKAWEAIGKAEGRAAE